MRAHFYGRSQNYLGILALWMTSEPPPPISSALVTVTMTPSRPLRWPTQKRCQCPLLMCGHQNGRPSKCTVTIKRQTKAAPWRKEGDSWRRNHRRTSGVRVRAALQPRKEHAMDNILDILQALALAASTARTIFELWREITHMSDE